MTKPIVKTDEHSTQNTETKPRDVEDRDLDAVAGGFLYKYNNG